MPNSANMAANPKFNRYCNCNCNVEFDKRANSSHSQNSHEGASSNVFRLLGDTNMFSV